MTATVLLSAEFEKACVAGVIIDGQNPFKLAAAMVHHRKCGTHEKRTNFARQLGNIAVSEGAAYGPAPLIQSNRVW